MSNLTIEIAGSAGGTSIGARLVRAFISNDEVTVVIKKGNAVDAVERTVLRAFADIEALTTDLPRGLHLTIVKP